MSKLRQYRTKHRGHEMSVYAGDAGISILTLGGGSFSTDIHLNAQDCRAIADMLLEAADRIDPKEADEAQLFLDNIRQQTEQK